MTIATRQFDEVKQDFARWKDSLWFSTWKIAVIADGSVTISFNKNVFLVTAVMNKDPDMGKDYMPLMIDFRESFSAAGKIGGGRFRKREGRPSDEAILYSRMTDRALRPLFPKGMINDLVISLSPLSLDLDQDLGVMSIIGASVATTLAGVPYAGPVGAVRIGYVDGDYVINPTKEQIEKGEMNLLVAGPRDSINMIEADGKEVENDILEKAWDIAIEHINQVIDWQEEFTKQVTITDKSDKVAFNKPSEDLISWVSTILTDDELTVVTRKDTRKEDFGEIYAELETKVFDAWADKMANDETGEYTKHNIKTAVFTVLKKYIRKNTINDAVRLDGRSPLEIRPLYCEVDIVPQVHGTALFWRGDTQVLASTTLGSPSDGQLKDTMEASDETDTFIHHYNFPPFSVNDARGTRGAWRREIGHGKLAEKALEYMIPAKEVFPYVVRVVSDCMWSGGSTSMWSVCASTMSLMAAWVPIKEPVSGIAMWLMTELDAAGKVEKYQVLDDIMGTEDFTGDMDFKIAGTKNGMTAIQLDTKLHGIPVSIIKETMTRGNKGRLDILDFMLKTIDQPRGAVSEWAPKIEVMQINPDKIKEVIGRGWENINKIIELADGIKIDIDEDGTIFMTHQEASAIAKAKKMIEDIAVELEPGTKHAAKISRVEKYGVFIKLSNGKWGLVHVSKLWAWVSDPTAKFKEGEAIDVIYNGTDNQWRMNFAKA